MKLRVTREQEFFGCSVGSCHGAHILAVKAVIIVICVGVIGLHAVSEGLWMHLLYNMLCYLLQQHAEAATYRHAHHCTLLTQSAVCIQLKMP